MPTTPLPRSSAAVNAEIRALMAVRVLTGDQAARYRELLVEWDAAVRREGDFGEAA